VCQYTNGAFDRDNCNPNNLKFGDTIGIQVCLENLSTRPKMCYHDPDDASALICVGAEPVDAVLKKDVSGAPEPVPPPPFLLEVAAVAACHCLLISHRADRSWRRQK